MASSGLHPAEHRGYRELYAYARRLVEHWPVLANRLEPGGAKDALQKGIEDARALLGELGPVTAAHGLHGGPAAQGVGRWLAGARGLVGDRFLERNQALRLAVGEAQHLSTLLGYLAAVAESRQDEPLVRFCRRWERRVRRTENTARTAAMACGADPHTAILPVDTSPVGRAAHGTSTAVGTLGEWLDRRAAEKQR